MRVDDKEAEAIRKGQERLAGMIYAVGASVGGPNLTRTLRDLWRGEDLGLDLSAGGEQKAETAASQLGRRALEAAGATQRPVDWVEEWKGHFPLTEQRPDETDKRLAEMNGALAALEVARGHLEGLEGMETGVAKAHCQGHRENLRLIQVQLRELAGKEDF